MKNLKSEVMKKAWEIKKENMLNIFSECLKMAWELLKKSTEKTEEKIYKITNEITKNTLLKIARDHYYSENIQEKWATTLEEKGSDFINETTLDYILNRVFETKKGGSFLNSTKGMFGNRGRCRFIKSCIEQNTILV